MPWSISLRANWRSARFWSPNGSLNSSCFFVFLSTSPDLGWVWQLFRVGVGRSEHLRRIPRHIAIVVAETETLVPPHRAFEVVLPTIRLYRHDVQPRFSFVSQTTEPLHTLRAVTLSLLHRPDYV